MPAVSAPCGIHENETKGSKVRFFRELFHWGTTQRWFCHLPRLNEKVYAKSSIRHRAADKRRCSCEWSATGDPPLVVTRSEPAGSHPSFPSTWLFFFLHLCVITCLFFTFYSLISSPKQEKKITANNLFNNDALWHNTLLYTATVTQFAQTVLNPFTSIFSITLPFCDSSQWVSRRGLYSVWPLSSLACVFLSLLDWCNLR